MRSLIILDLDHTLIYGSYAEKETADLLYKHSVYWPSLYSPPVFKTVPSSPAKSVIV